MSNTAAHIEHALMRGVIATRERTAIPSPEQLHAEVVEQFAFNGVLNKSKALGAYESAYAALWESTRPKPPCCPECGTILEETDVGKSYPVLRGDSHRQEFIPQAWWCAMCEVGIEAADLA